MKNPLLIEFKKKEGNPYLPIGNRIVDIRTTLAEEFAWGIPNEQALEEIAKYQPIIEVGAGLGYWARLLQEVGVEIYPTDIDLPHVDEMWTQIYFGAAKNLLDEPIETLFMCWVPEREVIKTLDIYQGDIFLWVGEKIELEDFEIEKEIEIPRWKGFEDSLFVFKRK